VLFRSGLAVVPFNPDTGRFVYEQIAIHNGWAMWRGKEYASSQT
jgi:hypothetical protein